MLSVSAAIAGRPSSQNFQNLKSSGKFNARNYDGTVNDKTLMLHQGINLQNPLKISYL